MFKDKVKSADFWKEVRTNPEYQFMIDELLEIYEQYAQGEIPDISYDVFMVFHRTGSRNRFEYDYYFPRRYRLNACALLSLIYPEKEEYLSNLMNTIWAICNEYCWALPNHTPQSDVEYNDYNIDLFAAETGYALSEIHYLLGDRLSPLINERIYKEVEKRIIQSFMDHTYGWETTENNWAAVCSASVACAFMYERPDLFETIKPRIDSAMSYFLASFKADGVCREGIGYWQYGFGFFVAYAQQLLEHTEGRINLFEDDHVKRIAQFPAKMFLDQKVTVSFSDGFRDGNVNLGTMGILRSHYGNMIANIPKECCVTHDACGRWNFHINSIVWYDPEIDSEGLPAYQTHYMEESGWFVKKCPNYGFAAKGGNNEEPHNHNDIGSFIISRNQRQILVDLGAGEYTADYFGDARYTILCNRSGGHSVPIIDGKEQQEGEEYTAATVYDGDKLTVDLTKAYPASPVYSMIREFRFDEKSIYLNDRYAWKESCQIIERFVTQTEPELTEGCIKLDEIVILYDDTAWEAGLKEDIFINHDCMEEKVYLIDFCSKQDAEEFAAEFRVIS